MILAGRYLYVSLSIKLVAFMAATLIYIIVSGAKMQKSYQITVLSYENKLTAFEATR